MSLSNDKKKKPKIRITLKTVVLGFLGFMFFFGTLSAILLTKAAEKNRNLSDNILSNEPLILKFCKIFNLTPYNTGTTYTCYNQRANIYLGYYPAVKDLVIQCYRSNCTSSLLSYLRNVTYELDEGEKGTIILFYSPYCPHCKKMIRFLSELKQEYNFTLIKINIINGNNTKLLINLHNILGCYVNGVPTLVIGDKCVMGELDDSYIQRVLGFLR